MAATLVHRGGRRPADLHLRGQRPDAREGIGAAAATFERTSSSTCVMSTPSIGSWRGWPASSDPEQKRKIIGDEFIRVFEEEAAKIGRIDFLTQGTLYPDVIESADLRDEGGPEDQDPPQRRRAADGPAVPAGSSRCATCSRTRSARSGWRSGCPRRWSGVSRSRARASRSASSARSPRSGWRRCARPTGSSSTRSRRPACTARCGRASRS